MISGQIGVPCHQPSPRDRVAALRIMAHDVEISALAAEEVAIVAVVRGIASHE